MITFFDYMAGIGGFRIGAERVGWKCVGYGEIDKFARRTYITNFDTSDEYVVWDVRGIKEGELPHFDVLFAGFPCQAFSLAGKRLGFEDTRGTLFFEIARILKEVQPKAFLLENVKGLVFHKKGKTLKIILSVLDELDYDVFHEVLNSKNFGVPQNRERIFFAGFRRDLDIKEFKFPKGFPLTVRLKDILEESVPEKYYLAQKYIDKFLKKKLEEPQTILRHSGKRGFESKENGISHSIKGGEGGHSKIMLLSHPKANIKKRIQKRGNTWNLDSSGGKIGIVVEGCLSDKKWGKSPVQSERVYGKKGISPTVSTPTGGRHLPMVSEEAKIKREGQLHRGISGQVYNSEGISPTIKSGSSKSNGGRDRMTGQSVAGSYLVGTRIRRLTPRECARLQAFPDEFKFPVSDTQTYKQLGNAVTVTVIEAIVKQMDKVFKSIGEK